MPGGEPPKKDGELFRQKIDKVLKKNNIKGFDISWIQKHLKEWYEDNIKGQ